MSDWIIDGKRSRLRNHRVLECGRRVHADGLREDVMTRCTDQWREWWEYLQRRASVALVEGTQGGTET